MLRLITFYTNWSFRGWCDFQVQYFSINVMKYSSEKEIRYDIYGLI